MEVNGADHAPAHLIGLAKDGWTVMSRGRERTALAKKDGKFFVCHAEDRPMQTPFGDYGSSAGEWVAA